ncbi:uncharacterized protein LOC143284505 [Babylonia areolata]|uniref:uncharacterized protein LOC143284505 n=1 Tax=Babylonia areolata TaxID=304850 RepID=UPI003FD472BE
MAAGPQCSLDESCVFTKRNQDEITNFTCQARHLIHRLQCASTRAKGDNNAPCRVEVSPQAMIDVTDDLEAAIRQLKDELKDHVVIHELSGLRLNKGRAQRDSGVVSWTPESGIPIQEEVGEGVVEVSSSPVVSSEVDAVAGNFGAGDSAA